MHRSAAEVRRNSDGSLDISYYRRRARRLNAVAKRQARQSASNWLGRTWARLVARVTPPRVTLATVWARAPTRVAVLLALGVAGPAFAQGFEPETVTRITVLEVVRLQATPDRVARLTRLDFGPGAAMVPHSSTGDEIMLVVEGAVVLEEVGRPPRIIAAGHTFNTAPGVVRAIRNGSRAVQAVLLVSGIRAAGTPEAIAVPFAY